MTRRTLRHYRDIGLFVPVESDADNGYHYYTMAQLPRLHRILALRELGFGLDQIQRMVDDVIAPGEVRDLMQRRKAEIERDLQRGRQSIRAIESRLQLLERGVADFEIVVKRLPSRAWYAATFRCKSLPHAKETFARVSRGLTERIDPALRAQFVSRMRSDAFEVSGMDIELGYLLEPGAEPAAETIAGLGFAPATLATVRTAATIVVAMTPDLWHVATTAIGQWLESNAYRITGMTREVWHELPGGDPTPVAELQWPVEPAEPSESRSMTDPPASGQVREGR